MRKQKIFNERGITLVALVVTIVILLILAGITIAQLSNSELFGKSQEAKEKWGNAQLRENTILDEYNDLIKGQGQTPISDPKTTPVTLGEPIWGNYYGTQVDYKGDGEDGEPKWYLYFADNENVYLIREAATSYSINDMRGVTDISETTLSLNKLFAGRTSDNSTNYFTENRNNHNVKYTAFLTNVDTWTPIYGKKGVTNYAIASPTAELFVKSYKGKHGIDISLSLADDSKGNGYLFNGSSYSLGSSDGQIYTSWHWIASPSGLGSNCVNDVGWSTLGGTNATSHPIRPIVSIMKSKVTNNNGNISINQ